MRLVKSLTLNQKRKVEDQVNDLDLNLNRVYTAMQGRIRFGNGTDGTNGENVSGQFQQITTSGTPNAENTIAHTLGSVPVGYIVLWQDKAGDFFQGPSTGTAWTSTNVYIKCSVATVTALIFLVK